MWVADMDFQSPPLVLRALQNRIEHGIFGYSVPGNQTAEAVIGWMQTRHQWTIQPDWIVWLPGLVCALNLACRAFSEPDQEILTATPIYPPFLSAPRFSGRKLVRCPLKRENAFYSFDFGPLEQAISPQTKVFLFCSPHNPVGRVWTKDELESIAQLCLRKNCLICSDEIHADLVLDPGKKHIPLASLGRDIADRTITLAAPSKTFNLPGLNCAYAIIPNSRLRAQFTRTMRGIVPHVNAVGYVACRAAYTHGGRWLADLIEYLRGNRDLVYETIRQIPSLSMGPVEATYLAWIDCRGLGIPNPALFFEEAGVGLSDGAEFDAPGFVRLNFACPRSRLQEALRRIQKAVCEHTL
jgi:cystathionine beta-lyase